MPAQLLVSVRSLQEAHAAIDGGAHIIDVKEPARGSLGSAQPEVIADIAALVHRISPGTVVSAALGEVTELATGTLPLPLRMPHPDLLKSGLSGLRERDVDWQDAWQRFRESAGSFRQDVRWVASAYADYRRSCSPTPLEVLEEGHRVGCPVLLIDTFQKDGTSLLDWASMPELGHIRYCTKEYGMKLALAGQINATLLPQILAVEPDIVAVRGAVCEHGHRKATVSRERVRHLLGVLQRTGGIATAG